MENHTAKDKNIRSSVGTGQFNFIHLITYCCPYYNNCICWEVHFLNSTYSKVITEYTAKILMMLMIAGIKLLKIGDNECDSSYCKTRGISMMITMVIAMKAKVITVMMLAGVIMMMRISLMTM